MPPIGIITGTRREARCLRQRAAIEGYEIACSGADAARACEQADALVAAGCRALLSFGVAGGLDPALAPGTVIVADTVIAPDGGETAADQPWRTALVAEMRGAGLAVAVGAILGVERPVTDVEAKRLLFGRTGALGIDMESDAVMRAARIAGIPGLAVRAIADAAGDPLPGIALIAIGRRGEIRFGALAAALIRRPRDLDRLVRLARVSQPAFDSLRRVAALPSLGGPL